MITPYTVRGHVCCRLGCDYPLLDSITRYDSFTFAVCRAIYIVGTDDPVGGRAHVGDRGLASSIIHVVAPTS